MRKTLSTFAVVGAAALFSLSACGGESDVATADEQTPEEFIEAFSTRCLQIQSDLDAMAQPETFGELAVSAVELQEVTAKGVDDLREMEAPDDLAEPVTEALDLLEQNSDAAAELVGIAESEDSEALDVFVEEQDTNHEAAMGLLDEAGITCEATPEDTGGDDTDTVGPTTDETDIDEPSADDTEDDTTSDEERDPLAPNLDLPPGDPAADIAEIGQDSEWDRAAYACEEGVMAACDALTAPEGGINAPEDTEMWAYGQSCGGRIPSKFDNYCGQLTFTPGE